MFLSLVIFLLGVILLLISTEKLVQTASSVSKHLKISPLIVGIVIVSFGTTLPELVVSTVSIIRGDVGLAVGNIIGSHVVNILLVFSVGIILGSLRIGTMKTQRNALILALAALLFGALMILPIPSLIAGIVLIGSAVITVIIEYRLGVKGRTNEDKHLFSAHIYKVPASSMSTLFILLPIIVMSGFLTVRGVELFAETTGISTTFLGLTLTAVATSLPELLTTILSLRRHEEKLTVGNIIGSNIYNLLFIGGIVTLFSGNFAISLPVFLWLAWATVIFLLILKYYSGRTPPRWLGLILILLFLVFIAERGGLFR